MKKRGYVVAPRFKQGAEDTCNYKRYLFQAYKKGEISRDIYEQYADPKSVEIAATPFRWNELSIYQFNS